MKKELEVTKQAPEQTELVSLIDNLYTDFSIKILEERLETDPLMLCELFDEITLYCVQCKKSDLTCSGEDGNRAQSTVQNQNITTYAARWTWMPMSTVPRYNKVRFKIS